MHWVFYAPVYELVGNYLTVVMLLATVYFGWKRGRRRRAAEKLPPASTSPTPEPAETTA